MTVTAWINSYMDMALAPPGTSFLTDKGEVVATGGLGWSPADFWAATPAEFHAAMRGRDGKASDKTTITPADARRHARAMGYTIYGEDD